MAPVPKDDPDRVHTHALVRETIEFSNGSFFAVWGVISSWRGPALGGPEIIDFTLHVFRDLVCVTIAFKTTVPSALALGASRTSNRSVGLADRGRLHRSRVHRVLVRAPRPSAVVSSRGLLRRRCAALAAPRGCRTSRPMSSNVQKRCGARG